MTDNTKTTVVISRPQPYADELAEKVRSLGFKPLVLGVYSTALTEDPEGVRSKLGEWLPAKWAVFTSRKSVQHAFELITSEDLAGTRVAAMGDGSARELRSRGVDEVFLPKGGYNSEAFLADAAGWGGNPGAVVIFCAPGGRKLLQDTLQNRGWTVHEAQVYRQVAHRVETEALDVIEAAENLICVFTSTSAMQACRQQLDGTLWLSMLDSQWVVVSERLAQKAWQLGATRVVVSPGPDNQAIADCLKSLKS